MIKYINSFSQINISNLKTLVVLDIDDTLISFKDVNTIWWDINYKKLYPIYKENTYNHLEKLWTDYIFNNNPMKLDTDNLTSFLKNIKNNNHELVILTARDKSILELTMRHLYDCGIYIDSSRVFFNRNKGYELKKIVMNLFPDVDNIIFVDDIIQNLVNVEISFNIPELLKYNLELYRIKHI